MQIGIDELLDYTDEERKKWEQWFVELGDGPLELTVAMGAHPNIGALLLHCFWAELFYALWMKDEKLTEDRIKTESERLSPLTAVKLFRFGRDARERMREFVMNASAEDWDRFRELEARGLRLFGPARKLIAHILIHEIRHFAQAAIVVRQNGLAPPGNHDMLFSESFGPLIEKLQ